MINARAFHTAQSLLTPSCAVLITGGINAKGVENSAELYIPGPLSSGQLTAGTFVAINPMNDAREQHTATLLPDGTVLLAGGASGASLVNGNAEIYNPFLQTFTPDAAPMLTPRVGHAAAALNSGFVLLTGGDNGTFGTTASAELYDPATGPNAAGASVSTSPVTKKGSAGQIVKAGTFAINNPSGAFESVSSVTVALSDPSLFASISAGSAAAGSPGASAELTFDPPLELAPGSSIELQFSGKLAKRERGGTSLQTLTGLSLSNPSGATTVAGLPASLGSVTEK